MKYCVECGKQLEDSSVQCDFCGMPQPPAPPPTQNSTTAQSSEPQQNAPQQPAPGNIPPGYGPYGANYGYNQPQYNPYYTNAEKPGTTLYLVWSIILSFFCSPLGIPGINLGNNRFLL